MAEAGRAVEGEWLTLEGLRVHFLRQPAGPAGSHQVPLLLVHGIACCTRTWLPLVRAFDGLPEAPPLLVPDLPAHGESERSRSALGVEAHADWLVRFLDAAGVAQVDVMGHSMGGQIAVALCQRHPDRVRKTVLLGPTLGERHAGTLRIGAGLMADSLREPFSYNLLLTRMFWRMGPLRYAATARLMQRHDAFTAAREVQCPTLVLQGTRDAIIPKGAAKSLSGQFSRGRYAEIAGAAHAAQFTHPGLVAELLMDFLE